MYDSSNNEDSGAESSDPATYRNKNLLKGNQSNTIAKKTIDRSRRSLHSSNASSLDENIDINEASGFPKGSLCAFTPLSLPFYIICQFSIIIHFSFVMVEAMASNYSMDTKSGSRSSSPFKKIKRFFKSNRDKPHSSPKTERKESDDIGQMTETSYYHVGSQRLHPPPSQEDNMSRQSMDERMSRLDDANSFKYSTDHLSVDNNSHDVSQSHRNPLYRSDDDVDIEKEPFMRSNEVRILSLIVIRLGFK